MATNYITNEALGFVSEYTTLTPYIQRRMWDMEDDEKNFGKVLDGGRRKIKLHDRELLDIDKYVVWNSVLTQQLRR